MIRRTPLTRTAMKRARKKPTPCRDAYAQRYYFDEILYWTGVKLRDGKPPQLLHARTVEGEEQGKEMHVNHIFTNPRRDWLSVLISNTADAHKGWHQNIPLGRMLALLSKARKAEHMGEPAEFDLGELNRASGKSVLGLVESYSFSEDWMQAFQYELICRMETIRLSTLRG